MTRVCRSPESRRRQQVVWIVVSVLALSRSALAAPRYLGPNKCISCHEHETQKAWSAKDKHSRALQQLEDPKASKYAGAIGLADPYDLKGSCVTCHATVFSGDAQAGVSCETCHGPGSDFLAPHQEKGAYAKAVSLGMIDTRGNYPVWASLCVNCHIVTDRKLTAAGHKSGADFEVGADSRKIVHWHESYDFAKLSAAGRVASSRRGGGAPPQVAPAPKLTPTAAPTKAPRAMPTSAPTREPRATPTSAPRLEAARSPTASPPRRELAPPTALPREVSTRVPTPMSGISPAPTPTELPTERPSPALLEPTRLPPTPQEPSGIRIVIAATPIPTTTPRPLTRAEQPSIPSPIEIGPPTTTTPTTRPEPTRVVKKPRRRTPARFKTPSRSSVTAAPVPLRASPRKAVSPPPPSPTPTRVRAPIEPPRRPPH